MEESSSSSRPSASDNMKNASSTSAPQTNRSGKHLIAVKSATASASSKSKPQSKQSISSKGNFKKPVAAARDKHAATQKSDIKLKPVAYVMKLPQELICRCFSKLDSVYDLLACASVCKAWREIMYHDLLWKEVYKRWWESEDSKECFHLPTGFNNWREVFIKKFDKGRERMLKRVISRALKFRYIQAVHPNRQLYNCMPGDGMLKLTEQLQLDFKIRVNNNSVVRLHSKDIVFYPASCMLHCPFKFIKKGLELSSLHSVEIIVASGKLSQTQTVAKFMLGKALPWDVIPLNSSAFAPLRLLQHSSGGCNLIVGSLLEDMDVPEDHIASQEQVLLMKAGVHLEVILRKLMKLGRDPSSHVQRQPVLDPLYGLHSYHVSVQLHTFDKLLWDRDFMQVFWNERESVVGEKAVLLLVSSCELVQAKMSLVWRSQAFSKEIERKVIADISVWDEHKDVLWQCVRVFHFEADPLITVEYGLPEFEGERYCGCVVDEERGIRADMKCSIPMSDEEDLFAITDLRITLTTNLLRQWFGVCNV